MTTRCFDRARFASRGVCRLQDDHDQLAILSALLSRRNAPSSVSRLSSVWLVRGKEQLSSQSYWSSATALIPPTAAPP